MSQTLSSNPLRYACGCAVGFYGSVIGKKIIVALTGAMLVGFLAGHLSGNLLIYVGPEAINEYAAWLKGLGAGLWAARISLLVALVLHVYTTISLVRRNRAARGPNRYARKVTVQASKASRYMIVSGLTILSFVVYHLLHFTFGFKNNYHDPNGPYWTEDGLHNVYQMVIDGFSWWPASAFYIISMALLCWHLSHGVASIFQTLGLSSERTQPVIALLAKIFALVLFLAKASIPVAVLLGLIN